MLFPKNFPMNRPSPHIDTYILRGLIWISYFLLFLGIYRKSWPSFPDLPQVWVIALSVSGFLILPLIFWILSSTGVIQHFIAVKLSKKPFHTQLAECPYCKFRNVELCREIISSTEMIETVSCPNCEGRNIVVSRDIGN